MRPRTNLLIAVSAMAVFLGVALPSRASCAPPMISIDTFQTEPGDRVQVAGQGWFSGCDDTGGSAMGCGSSDPPSEPVTDIELRLKGPRTDQTQQQLNIGAIGETAIDLPLGTVDADAGGEFTTTIEIPDVADGTYFVTGLAELPAYQPPQIDIKSPHGR